MSRPIVEIGPNSRPDKNRNPFRLRLKKASISMSYEELGEMKDVLENFLESPVTPASAENPLGRKHK